MCGVEGEYYTPETKEVLCENCARINEWIKQVHYPHKKPCVQFINPKIRKVVDTR